MTTEVEIHEVDPKSYSFQHEIVIEYPDELRNILFTETNLKVIISLIRKSYRLDNNEVLNGIYIVPSLNTLYALFFEKGKLLSRELTQSTCINLMI